MTTGSDSKIVSVFAVGENEVIAEIIQGADRARQVRGETAAGIKIEDRFLVIADDTGKVTRIEGVIQPWERSIGWMAAKRQLVTEDLRNHSVIRIRAIP